MVYVLNKNGKPLMPTNRLGRVRRLLKEHKAVIVSYHPFTIQLTYACPDRVQGVSLGVDAGSKHVGLSATTKQKVLFEAQLELYGSTAKNLSTRREFRHNRRSRKTRYRKPRFLNRTKCKKQGWVAPSIRAKIQSHLYWIDKIHAFLPVNHTTVEVAQFDTQLLKARESGLSILQGSDYQQGEQMGFWNAREYVLFRDNHTCQCCRGKSKDPILNVHHIESRKTGGNAPNNLVTLCETCHKNYHSGKIELPKSIKRGRSYRDAAFMGIMRWKLMDILREKYGDRVSHTYGYLTKKTRIENGLLKDHTVDARCISGNPFAVVCEKPYIIRKVRCHNRQLHKATVLKGGIRVVRSSVPREYNGFRHLDVVKYAGMTYFIKGRRMSGYFSLCNSFGVTLVKSVNCNKLNKINHNNTNLVCKGVA